MEYTKTQWESFPTTKDAEVISCQYCENETVVKANKFVTRYTCPTCYSVPKLSKRK